MNLIVLIIILVVSIIISVIVGINIGSKQQRMPNGASEVEVNRQVRAALDQAQGEFQEWNEQENRGLLKEANAAMKIAIKSARTDAAKRSKVTVSGQMFEVFAPFLPGWRFNPKDAQFLGHGIDFLVFDGLTAETDVTVHFIEIKTGKSRQNKREKMIEAAIEAGRVKYEILRIDTPEPIKE